MSDPEIIELPASSCAARATIQLQRVISKSESSFTLAQQLFRHPGEKWLLTIQMPPIVNRVIAGQWKAFGLRLKGGFNRFRYGDPLAKNPMGIATGSPVVDGAGQTGNELEIRGAGIGVAGWLLAGDMLQIGDSLHMNVADADTDGAGKATLLLEPALRTSPADGAAIILTNPRGLFKLVENTWGWEESPGPRWDISFNAEEVINA
jgi:hypothetical protein